MAATTQKRKVISAVTAVVVSAAILLTGTFAWQSISQVALNERTGEVNPGGRLHDDFDGTNKDVYVENFMTEAEGGVPIYARVRLDEYMEIGVGAGLKTGDSDYASKEAVSLVTGANINDVSTWKTHIPDAADDPFHTYWEWTTGGSTIYMPTFNKNKDSLKADINGTYDGTDATDNIYYDDYVAYTAGESKTADAVYDADDNTVDEGDAAVEGTNITTVSETHTAANTQSGTVMTMQEWIDAGSQPGAYWVYDVDGWAYWAQAIEPGTATGLLLDGISLQKEPGDNWYYGINVVGQFATMGDWGTAEGSDGFFGENDGPAPTDNALFLLNQAAGRSLTVTVSAAGNATQAKLGDTLQMSAAVKLGDAAHSNQAVSWSVPNRADSGTTINANGLLTIGGNETVGNTLTVRAVSRADSTVVGEYSIKVNSSWDTSGIGDITPGTLNTATVDGIEYYVLARNGNNALLLTKDLQEERRFDGSSPKWETSEMRTYLNGDWLNAQTTLSQHTVKTTINTRSTYNGTEFTATQDKVFLLSEADVYGTQNGSTAQAKDYTLGTEGVILPSNMRTATWNGTNYGYWLRSPCVTSIGLAGVYSNGSFYFPAYYDTGRACVRPALWVNLAG